MTFLLSDVGREIVSGAGLGTITGYTDTTHVTVEITQAFAANTVEVGQWTILGSPNTTCTPSASSPAGATITLTLTLAGWRAEDVGKFVSINGGLCRITGFTSTQVVDAVIVRVLTGVVAAPALAWKLEGSVWGGVNGYPRCGTIFGQRLYVAGSPGFPQTFWGSTIGEYLDFMLGTADDEALSYVLASDQLDPILHLAQAGGLVALTYGGEYSIRGGNEKPITPTNVQVKKQSNYGCNRVPPRRVAAELFFNQRAGRKIRALAPDRFDSEQYGASDISILSEHVTKTGVVAMAYQAEPMSVLYVPRADGVMATLTADQEQGVFGWARQITNGLIESVCSVPVADGDRVFAVVRRIINGAPVRYIEMFDPALLTDSALTGSNPSGATTWTGLNHLEGRTVNVKADGVALTDRVVTGGEITIERPAFDIEIGLNYSSKVVTLTPELPTDRGSSQGANMSINRIIVRLLDTIGCTINYQIVPFKQLGLEVLDKPPQPFTGDKEAGNLGWESGFAQTIIQQNKPYPFHLLAVIAEVTVNHG